MAEFIDRRGNIFTSSADVTVVTVNCKGVMGAGIALEAKLRWPNMFVAYRDACDEGELQPGGLWWWRDPATGERLLCFATKGEWRLPSRIEWIDAGLAKLASSYGDEGVTSIAVPRLGASHGGLAWDEVRPVIIDRLEACEELTVELWDFDPAGEDPWFAELSRVVRSDDPVWAAKQLNMTPRQFENLRGALDSPRVVGLSSLVQARGVGERTLEKVYEYLFHRAPTPPPPETLF